MACKSDYATGQSRVSNLIEIIFALMRHFDVSPADARRIAGLPPENYGDQRRNRVYVGRKRMILRWRMPKKRETSQLCKAAGVRNKLAPEDRISGVPTAIARPERD
jgi:hypothetical protein